MTQANATAAAVYDENLGTYNRLLEEVLFALSSVTSARDIKTHTVLGRVKTRESYIDKVERKNTSDPAAEIRDVVGVRIVCLFLSDLPRLRTVIEDTFEVIEVDDKIDGGDLTSFGYMSIHYICRLLPQNSGPRYEGLQNTVFEIQCRTIVMDAWANVSHYLAYKGDASVPDHLRRDFNALSGLFYVADQHFQMFFGEALNSRNRAMEQVAKRVDQNVIPINLDTMLAYLAAKYPDRELSPEDNISEFVEEVSMLDGYNSIGDLDRALASADKAVLRYERENPPSEGGKYASVGLARTALAIADPEYANLKYHGIAEHYAQFRSK